MRRRQRDRQWRRRRFLPPIELLDPADAGRPDERAISQRRHHERIEALREHAERPQIAVVVVIVTQQHHRDRRQIVEPHGRLSNAPRSDDDSTDPRVASTSDRSGCFPPPFESETSHDR